MNNIYFRNPIPCFGFETINCIEPQTKVIDIISTEELYADLAYSGAVIYRGFSDSLEDFNELVSKHSSKVTFDPARVASTSNTAEINAGSDEMGLHQENGSLPFQPDMQWFYCMHAPIKDSETTMCDGQKVLFELSSITRKKFENNNIKYTRRIPWERIKKLLSVELEIPIEKISDDSLLQVNEMVSGQIYSRIDTNLISSQLTINAIIRSCFSKKNSFCNSMLGPSINYEPPLITWEDNSDIDLSIWDEIKYITKKLTYNHVWQKGDIIAIDNSRVMHGRRKLDGSLRRIFGAQSYRKETI